ncbi:hypothetical protein HID58_001009, partial [Brassica napus]
IEENIPPIPSCIFRPQSYPQLISLASATNFLPGKKKPFPVSQTNKFSFFSLKTNYYHRCCWPICLIQGSDIYNKNTDTKIIIALRLHRSKMVRLTIWNNKAENFRELNRISTRKN